MLIKAHQPGNPGRTAAVEGGQLVLLTGQHGHPIVSHDVPLQGWLISSRGFMKPGGLKRATSEPQMCHPSSLSLPSFHIPLPSSFSPSRLPPPSFPPHFASLVPRAPLLLPSFPFPPLSSQSMMTSVLLTTEQVRPLPLPTWAAVTCDQPLPVTCQAGGTALARTRMPPSHRLGRKPREVCPWPLEG